MLKKNDIGWLPLNSLRAFAAVHETGSVGAAASVLRVTHGAVSQHLNGLEDRLQRKLFTRSGRRLVMLPEAEALAENLARHFKAMAGDIDRFRRDRNIINITVTPHFAQYWLLPRLGEFQHHHPDIELRINADAAVHDLENDDFDAAIRHGDGNWPELNCETLLESKHVVVAAPSLLASASIQTSQDLTKLPWILDADRNTEMADWFETHDIALQEHTRITRLPSALTLAAALDGNGVAWLPLIYAEPYLAAERLVRLFSDDEDTERNARHYYLCWPDRKERPALRAFRRWIRQKPRELP